MNCEYYKEIIPEYISGELAEDKVACLEKHILECEACRKELNFERSLLADLSEDSYDLPMGLNSSVIDKLPKIHFIFTNTYFVYSAAASIVLMIILSMYLNFSGTISQAPLIVSNTDTLETVFPKNDNTTVVYVDQDLEDMIDYDTALYDSDKWSSDSSEIFASDNEIVNDLITLEELETYDDYLTSL